MKKLQYLLLLFVVACSSPKFVYDYDTQEDFAKFKTFNFFSDAGKGLNEFDTKRIEFSIENFLIAQGMKKDSVPDFYINFFAKEHKEDNRNTVGVTVGGGGGNVGFGISGGIPIGAKKMSQLLTIDFVKASNDELFWQCVANSRISKKATPQQRKEYYKSLIEKVLQAYPPKK